MRGLLIGLALASAACASGPEEMAGPPDYALKAADPAPERARLYTDCIAQAIARGRVGHDQDGDSNLLRFTCDGAPAAAFFAGLEAWSAEIGSGFEHEGRRYRSTTRVQRDLFGVDHCSVDASGADGRCSVVLNTGPFLAKRQ